MNNRNMRIRLEALEAIIRPPDKPAWQRAMEEHERVWAEIDAHFAAFVAEHCPNYVPVDEASLTPEERAERGAVLKAMREDCLRCAAELSVG